MEQQSLTRLWLHKPTCAEAAYKHTRAWKTGEIRIKSVGSAGVHLPGSDIYTMVMRGVAGAGGWVKGAGDLSVLFFSNFLSLLQNTKLKGKAC